MSTSWWRRNRLWLALLLPMLLLALAASSFRFVTLYRPWQWSAPIVANGPAGTLTQEFLGFDDARHTRTVGVRVVDVSPVPEHDGNVAVEGATLWRVDLDLTAEPDQLLAGPCTLYLLDAAGVRHGTQGGRTAAPGNRFPSFPGPLTCVPGDTPGPQLEPFTGALVPAAEERPRTWRLTTTVVAPEGVEPVAVMLGWNTPEYLLLSRP